MDKQIRISDSDQSYKANQIGEMWLRAMDRFLFIPRIPLPGGDPCPDAVRQLCEQCRAPCKGSG